MHLLLLFIFVGNGDDHILRGPPREFLKAGEHDVLKFLVRGYYLRSLLGPFLERPSNLTGPVSYFEIKVSRRVGCVLTSNEVQFVSLADNFTVQFSNLLKLSSGMENKTP